jgi:hypothetical protein
MIFNNVFALFAPPLRPLRSRFSAGGSNRPAKPKVWITQRMTDFVPHIPKNPENHMVNYFSFLTFASPKKSDKI